MILEYDRQFLSLLSLIL